FWPKGFCIASRTLQVSPMQFTQPSHARASRHSAIGRSRSSLRWLALPGRAGPESSTGFAFGRCRLARCLTLLDGDGPSDGVFIHPLECDIHRRLRPVDDEVFGMMQIE